LKSRGSKSPSILRRRRPTLPRRPPHPTPPPPPPHRRLPQTRQHAQALALPGIDGGPGSPPAAPHRHPTRRLVAGHVRRQGRWTPTSSCCWPTRRAPVSTPARPSTICTRPSWLPPPVPATQQRLQPGDGGGWPPPRLQSVRVDLTCHGKQNISGSCATPAVYVSVHMLLYPKIECSCCHSTLLLR
jgi:hypothetical protein